jgi:hypothetical protein
MQLLKCHDGFEFCSHPASLEALVFAIDNDFIDNAGKDHYSVETMGIE